ncbi:MAG TPA: sulfite exporter TauE/SafE family protein [Blastocatellia bacterium]|nr:sulfite exporter TauE/SafE family protein [Blastocatellia bacterium]
MDSHLAQLVVAFVAAFLAGMVNSVAGGGTLISFPVLVWIGVEPQAANVTNTVALWPGSLGGMIGFRRELAGSRRWMLLLGAPSVAGGLLGAFWLLKTNPRTFAAIVPYLILFATILFALQEPLTRRLRRSDDETPGPVQSPRPPPHALWIGAAMFQFVVAVYGGYFGAGIGILMLATLGVLGLTDIHQMNGLKNCFAVCINVIAAAYFMLWGPVRWNFAAVMAVGAIAGGYGGAGLGRKLGRVFVRRFVIVIGLAMAISLLLRGG